MEESRRQIPRPHVLEKRECQGGKLDETQKNPKYSAIEVLAALAAIANTLNDASGQPVLEKIEGKGGESDENQEHTNGNDVGGAAADITSS